MATTTTPGRTAGQLGRELIETVARQDIDAARSFWTDDSVDDFVALGREVRGADALAEFFRATFAAFPDFHMEVVDVTDGRDRAAVQWHITATFTGEPFEGIKATGKPLDLRGVDCLEFADGKLVRNTVYYDGADFARQIGMLPARGSAGERTMTAAFNAATTARSTAREKLHR
jgi:steroid delta-isomerase-like uncharacterized protein